MRKNSVPKALLGPMHKLFVFTMGGVPASKETGKAEDPELRVQEITRKASIKAAAVSGSLALPVGPLGMLTVVPDLVIVWRIQVQMVVDIAAACGYKKKLTQEDLMACLFNSAAAGNSVSRSMATRLSQKVAQTIVGRIAKRASSRLVPLAGAAMVSTYVAMDTKEVARAATEMFNPENEQNN